MTTAVRHLARLYPWDVSRSAELDRALAFLDVSVDSPTVVRAGYGTGVLLALATTPALALAPPSLAFAVGAVVIAVSFGGVHAVHRAPVALAAARRTSALGEAPGLVGRAALRMRIAPASESAAAFAARNGTGPLASSLGECVRRANGTPESGFPSFASEWGDWNPELRRAVLLVEAAADAPEGERGRTLDRALTAILDGTRNRMAEFANEVHGPTTAVYAFGVLLPLALVAVLPAARVAGVPVSVTALIAVYDLALPGTLVVASAWLLARRPVAFPPPEVSASHPDVPDRRWPVVLGSCLAGIGGLVVAAALLPEWTRWLALCGCGVGTLLVGWYRPVTAVRDRARAVEANLTDALYLIGRRVKEGQAVETSIDDAADETAGATGEVLAHAAHVQRQLRTGVRESFLGEHGALADVPSPRSRSTAALLALAAREGRPAGSAVVAMADHLDDLQQVERDARHELARVTGTLRTTATVFGPLVAGATVALADGMAGAGGSLGRAIPTGALGLAVGAYVLLLAAVLTALATGLQRGLDRALVGYRVGLALVSAVGVYLAAFVGAGLLV